MDLSEATLGQDSQLIITGEDGHGYPVSVSGMITVPMSSMYQMVANIQHLHQNGDGTVCLTPIQVSNSGGGGGLAGVQSTNKFHILRATPTTATAATQQLAAGSNGSSKLFGGGGGGGGENSNFASLLDVIQYQIKSGNNNIAPQQQSATSQNLSNSSNCNDMNDVVDENDEGKRNDCNNNENFEETKIKSDEMTYVSKKSGRV